MITPETKPIEAIILAGGKGTRLQSMSGNQPKPMMPVYGKPFLSYLLEKLRKTGIQRIILSVGYNHDKISGYFGDTFKGIPIKYCIEEAPLGTGGALLKAVCLSNEQNILVLNGDSYYEVDVAAIFKYHIEYCADVTIALKQLDNCSRFGTVSIHDHRIVSFKEKGYSGSGYINSGVYVVNRRIVEVMPRSQFFSFETEVLENIVTTHTLLPYISDGYFIDIGTPDDYQKANTDFSHMFGNSR